MTVREFIDQIKSLTIPTWERLTPVSEEWGDCVQTACAVTALAEPYADKTTLGEKEFVNVAIGIVREEAEHAGMEAGDAHYFAECVVDGIQGAFDGWSDPSEVELLMDCDVTAYTMFGTQIGWQIGHELRKYVLGMKEVTV